MYMSVNPLENIFIKKLVCNFLASKARVKI